MNSVKKAVKKLVGADDVPEKLKKWRTRFEEARNYYADSVSVMKKDMTY